MSEGAPAAGGASEALAAPRRRKVLLVAGEMSGDLHAARLLRDMGAARQQVDFFGIGGEALAKEGMRILVDAREMAVVGFWEVIKRLPFLLGVWRRIRRALVEERPDAVLLVDYPGFNLKVAAYAKALGIPVLYYVSPQVWAWNRRRIPRMAKIIDRLMVIFPFEVDVFKGTGLDTVFVGHPLVPGIRATLARPCGPVAWPDAAAPEDRVALLPGSRRMEVERILPALLDAAEELHRRRPGVRFAIAAAGEEQRRMIEAQLARRPEELRRLMAVEVGNMRDVVRSARAAMVCSGTATVETGLLGCPLIVVYRAAPITFWVGRRVVKVKWLGMVNLVADRTICPEYLQQDSTPDAMASMMERLLDDTPERRDQLDGLAAVARALAGDSTTSSAGRTTARFLGLAD